ncbi:hydrogenase iron-sulfur subunit [Archaeoglobus veneficus]|uniref:CoB--CoM heterodisulfide reductase iron-sulfur subunit A n=1 Tax=Archaeoglobus veneficus (strain DSM 11195 / SNP6) TaxID=693661 RepID=F2KRB4_ARCVS|nr:hydrogenase iron-sulfur subunit [Archaeoglobus veneficus]AEA47848.1 methyl-viologen-reducing hydrogenase delta subunit [Archaeoglobus veneficus SNP6]
MAQIGVVICSCGGQISEKIDLNKLEEVAKGLKDVVKIIRTDFLCTEDIEKLRSLADCDRILFAACSERSSLTFNEDRIAAILEEIGINRAMYEVANIREQCAWIHDGDVTGKAIDMLKMTHVKLLMNKPAEEVEVRKKALVVGGGVAGMQAAIDLAREGVEAVLVEKKPYIGGHTCQIPLLFQCESWPSMCTSECIIPVLAREVMNSGARVFTNSEVVDIWKENGNFVARIRKAPQYVDPSRCISCGKCSEVCPVDVENSFDCGMSKRKAIDKEFKLAIPDIYNIVEECTKCGECVEACPTNAINLDAEEEIIEEVFGTVIISTGFKSFDLRRLEELNYTHPRVISSMEMERIIARKMNIDGEKPEHVVFVLCSGSRAEEGEEGVPYCSKTCCAITVKQANRVMVLSPETEITVIYNNDVRAYERAFEKFYRNAQNAVDFVNGRVEEIDEENGMLKIIIETPDGDEEEIEADLVVLAEAVLPEGVELLEKLKVRTDRFGFPIEFQPRILRPTESHVDRVYVAGSVSGPKIVQEAVEQGATAALRAKQSVGIKKLPKFVSKVDQDLCSACRICEAACPHGAIDVKDFAYVDPAFCQGCGLCMAACPSNAIQLVNFEDEQIIRQAEVGFEHADGPKILALLCYWCSYAAADLMGRNGIKIPPNVRTIRIRCSSSINSNLIAELLKRVDGILIAGCPPKNCHHLWGNYMMAKRVGLMNPVMAALGAPNAVRWEYIGVTNWAELGKVLNEMDKYLREVRT